MSAIAVDPLIAEAKRRARRRQGYLLAAVASVAAGAAIYGLLPSSGPAGRATRPVNRVTGTVAVASAGRVRTVSQVGSSGGVTWVMNGRGLWLTEHGGHAWRKVALPRGTGSIYPENSFVQFVDRRRGWISIDELTAYPHRRERSMFARTTDGGRTWQPSFPAICHGRCGSEGMSFLDAHHGFLLAGAQSVGIPNELWRTADGGRTWQPVAKVSIYGPITFLNERVGFAFVGSGGPMGPYLGPPTASLYRTTDGGRTWSEYDLGGVNNFVEVPIAVVHHHVLVVQNGPHTAGGEDLAPRTIYVSPDGEHWRGTPVPAGVSYESRFTGPSANAWAFASRRDVYTTTDAGGHWRRIHLRGFRSRFPRQPVIPSGVAFTSSQAGWAVLNRRLYRTTDGGLRWAVSGPPKPKPAPVPACDPATLTARFWIHAVGPRYASGYLNITNPGRLACTLSGWPTVVAVTANGKTVQAKRISLASARALNMPHARSGQRVVLGTAWVELDGTNVRRNNHSVCPRAVRLKVTLPGGRTMTLAGPWQKGREYRYFPLCGGISVTPVFRH